MIPYGGRERNFDDATSGLSSRKLEQPVFGLWLCVKVRTHLFDIRRRWYIADGRVASLSVVVAHPVVHHCDQIIETLGFQEQRVSLAFETPVEGLHPLEYHREYSWQALDCPWLPA